MIGKPIPSGWKRPLRSEMTSPTFVNNSRYTLLSGGYKTVDGICYIDMVLQLNWEITATAYDNVVIPSWWGSYITGFPTPKDGYCPNLNVSWAKYTSGNYNKQCEGDAMIFQYDALNMSISIISRATFNAEDISNHLITCHITGEYEV